MYNFTLKLLENLEDSAWSEQYICFPLVFATFGMNLARTTAVNSTNSEAQ